MDKKIIQLLQILDWKMDFKSQQEIFKCSRRALNWEETDRLPLVVNFPYPKSGTIQAFPHSETFDNPEKMLFNELVHAFDTSIFLHPEIDDDLPFTIRANFGTVIIASLFGGKIEQRGDNPPWLRHFETPDEFNTIFEKDPWIFHRGFVPGLLNSTNSTGMYWKITPI